MYLNKNPPSIEWQKPNVSEMRFETSCTNFPDNLISRNTQLGMGGFSAITGNTDTEVVSAVNPVKSVRTALTLLSVSVHWRWLSPTHWIHRTLCFSVHQWHCCRCSALHWALVPFAYLHILLSILFSERMLCTQILSNYTQSLFYTLYAKQKKSIWIRDFDKSFTVNTESISIFSTPKD